MHCQHMPPSFTMCEIRLIRTLCLFRSEPLQELEQSFTNRDDSRADSELQSLINTVKVGQGARSFSYWDQSSSGDLSSRQLQITSAASCLCLQAHFAASKGPKTAQQKEAQRQQFLRNMGDADTRDPKVAASINAAMEAANDLNMVGFCQRAHCNNCRTPYLPSSPHDALHADCWASI